MRKRRAVAIAAAIAVAAAGAAAAIMVVNRGDTGSAATASSTPATSSATGTTQVVRTDLATTQQVNGTLGYAGAADLVNQTEGTAFTALPVPGTVIDRGQTVYEVDGRPVPLLFGPRPAWRTLAVGVTDGPDVHQLEDNLVALGYADPVHLSVDNHFTAATAAAVRRWQHGLGRLQTGVVHVGDAVWAPGPLRVGVVPVAVGTPAHAGTVVMHTTTTDRVVTMTLPVTSEHLVKPGDAVAIHLPDGSTTPGTVASIAALAASPPNSEGGPPPRAIDATVDVTATLTHPDAAGTLDEAPVAVDITDAAVHGVLAVPINALVAPPGGGFAVEVVDGASHHLVTVHPGLFAQTMVEITGAGIAEGTTVVVPAS
jgi:hypothetical protein